MQTVQTFLTIHIAFGTLSLISAIAALSVAKGQLAHRRFGKVYVASMTLVVISALLLAIPSKNTFLISIALFSGYFIYSGLRFAHRRNHKISILDWSLLGVFFIVGIAMAVLGVLLQLKASAQAPILLFFAAFTFLLAGREFLFYRQCLLIGKVSIKDRLKRHLAHMLAATIATTTAFFVVNVSTNPLWLAWIIPTLCLTPLIIYWSKRVERRGIKKRARA